MVRHFVKAVFLVVILLGVVPSIQAAEPRGEVSSLRSDSGTLVSWSFLVDLWNVLTGSWSENGCEFDPDGRCSPRQGTATIDNGCELDPDGGCTPRQGTAVLNNGCEFDPNGGCSPRQGVATIENGCEVDPNGGCRR